MRLSWSEKYLNN